MRDGAPTHFCAPVRDWLDIVYPGRRIGRPVLWPPSSPDLTPLNFSYRVISRNWCDVVTAQMDLFARLYSACTSVDPAVL
ncbi:uncharacterized protein TNCV_2187401 [Trichonephila clavipes]|nr:uncharacterized protein TNCV_2187401 [Trichonephila clavipes]